MSSKYLNNKIKALKESLSKCDERKACELLSAKIHYYEAIKNDSNADRDKLWKQALYSVSY